MVIDRNVSSRCHDGCDLLKGVRFVVIGVCPNIEASWFGTVFVEHELGRFIEALLDKLLCNHVWVGLEIAVTVTM